MLNTKILGIFYFENTIFSSPGRSPGRVIVLLSVSALVSALAVVSALAKY